MHECLRQAPEHHLVRIQHVARLLDEPVPYLDIYGHLLEAKAQIGDVVATPRHEGMDMISILIVPVWLKIERQHVRKIDEVATHTVAMGTGFLDRHVAAVRLASS